MRNEWKPQISPFRMNTEYNQPTVTASTDWQFLSSTLDVNLPDPTRMRRHGPWSVSYCRAGKRCYKAELGIQGKPLVFDQPKQLDPRAPRRLTNQLLIDESPTAVDSGEQMTETSMFRSHRVLR